MNFIFYMPDSETIKSSGFSFLSKIIKWLYTTSRIYIFFYFYPNAIFKSNLGHIGCQFCTAKKLDKFSKDRLSVLSINICQFINSLKISSTSGFIPFHVYKRYRRSCLKFCNVLIQILPKTKESFCFPSGACGQANFNTSKHFIEWAWTHVDIWDR